MSKKKKKKKLQNKTIVKQKASIPFLKFLKNDKFLFAKHFLLALLIIVLCYVMTKPGGSYHWYLNNLHKINLNYAFGKNGVFTTEQKNEIKLGFNYKYLEFINKNTPENAIIIFPNQDIFLQKDSEAKFTNYITRKGYASYFVYPRKIVYENEKGLNEWYDKATHVAIVNNWGYDKLKYNVQNTANYTVLSIHQP